MDLKLQILSDAVDRIRTNVVNSLQSSGRHATGKTAASLETVLSGDKAQLLAPEYIDALEKGRKPTSPGAKPGDPLMIERIREWCAAKGIAEAAAWPIKKKIDRVGYVGKPGVLTTPLSDQNVNVVLDETMQRLALLVTTEITDSLKV